MPKFSIIMQSYLGQYEKAASDRDNKILRAINSVLKQTFEDWELVIVCDGCQKSYDLVCLHYISHMNIECILIPKQTQWSGNARNYGIGKATGDYILYLDIDDQLGPDHLKRVDAGLGNHDWVWFNDWVMSKNGKPFERQCLINQRFQHGTSNICHKRSLDVKWTGLGYGYDDHSLVKALLKHHNFKKIETPEYIVCHLPGRLDV